MGEMKAFLDTNIIIDFLGEREPFYQDAACIFEMLRKRKVNLITSALTLVNCAYILKKAYSQDVMLPKIKWLCDVLDITPIDEASIVNAIQHKGTDFEDIIQYYSALPYQPDVIITRDKKGFSNLDILVMTPAEFIERSRR